MEVTAAVVSFHPTTTTFRSPAACAAPYFTVTEAESDCGVAAATCTNLIVESCGLRARAGLSLREAGSPWQASDATTRHHPGRRSFLTRADMLGPLKERAWSVQATLVDHAALDPKMSLRPREDEARASSRERTCCSARGAEVGKQSSVVRVLFHHRCPAMASTARASLSGAAGKEITKAELSARRPAQRLLRLRYVVLPASCSARTAARRSCSTTREVVKVAASRIARSRLADLTPRSVVSHR